MTDIVDLFNACLYIQDHLDADLSLLFLAQTVGLSRFRFHRVFKAWRGETLHDFVTRMRMERAAFELRYPIPRSSRRSIKAIAFASGYKSLSSFSHAFSSYARVSPREFRNLALRQRPGAPEAGDDFGAFTMTVGHQPERRIAILDPAVAPRDGTRRSATSRIGEAAATAGPRFGVELLPNLLARARGDGGFPSRVSRLTCVGVALGDWHASAARQGSEGAVPRSVLTLESGRYAVLEGSGTFVQLYRAWRRGFDRWLAATGECPKPGRLYLSMPPDREAGGFGSIQLFVPLEEPPAPVFRPSRPRGGDAADETRRPRTMAPSSR